MDQRDQEGKEQGHQSAAPSHSRRWATSALEGTGASERLTAPASHVEGEAGSETWALPWDTMALFSWGGKTFKINHTN